MNENRLVSAVQAPRWMFGAIVLLAVTTAVLGTLVVVRDRNPDGGPTVPTPSVNPGTLVAPSTAPSTPVTPASEPTLTTRLLRDLPPSSPNESGRLFEPVSGECSGPPIELPPGYNLQYSEPSPIRDGGDRLALPKGQPIRLALRNKAGSPQAVRIVTTVYSPTGRRAVAEDVLAGAESMDVTYPTEFTAQEEPFVIAAEEGLYTVVFETKAGRPLLCMGFGMA